MNKEEHLQWCKNRAIKHLDRNDIKNAFKSFTLDMMEHEETREHPALELGLILKTNKHLDTVDKMKRWIEGFN